MEADDGEIICEGCLSLVGVDTNVYMKIMQSRNGG